MFVTIMFGDDDDDEWILNYLVHVKYAPSPYYNSDVLVII